MRDNHWYSISKSAMDKAARAVSEINCLASAFRTIGDYRLATKLDVLSATLEASLHILDRTIADALADELKPTMTGTSPCGRYEWEESKPVSCVDIVTFK